MPLDRAQELVKLGELIKRAEDEMETFRLRLKGDGGSPPDRSDPSDPISCLEIWLAALYGRRAELLRPLH